MSLSVISISEILPGDWDRLVRSSPDGWVFALHGWQQLVTDVDEWGFEEHGFGLMEEGRLLAVCPLHFRAATRNVASSGWGGAGPVIAGDLATATRARIFGRAIEVCLNTARRTGAERLDISCSPVTVSSLGARWGVNPLAVEKLADTSLLSQVIALDAGEDELWMGLSKTARNLVRRAEKKGYRTEAVDWLASLDTYYEIHTETYTRTGVTPHPKRYFEGIANRIAPSGASRLIALLTPGGEPIAYHNTAQLGQGACYHTGCSRDVAQDDSIGYLLMWEAIKAAKRAGALWFDCGWIFPAATDNKQQGLTLFKTRFGGEPHRAFRAELVGGLLPSRMSAEPPAGAATIPSPHPLGWTKLQILRRLRPWLTGTPQ